MKSFLLLCCVSASLSCVSHAMHTVKDEVDPESAPLNILSSTSESRDDSAPSSHASSSRALSHSFWFPTTKIRQMACLGLAATAGLIVGGPAGSAVTYVAMGGSLASLATLFATNITTLAPLASTTPGPTLDPRAEAIESQRWTTCHLAYGKLPEELTFEGVLYSSRQATPECDQRVNTDMLVPHPGTTRFRGTSDMWGQRMLAFLKTEITRNPPLSDLTSDDRFVGNMHWALCAFSFEEKEEIKKHFPLLARAIDQGFSCPDRGCITQK